MSSATAIHSGELRHRIRFLRNAATRVAGGSVTDDFRPIGTMVACRVAPLSGSKQFLAMQAQSRITHIVTMRYRAGVSAHDRIQWGGRTFQIDRVLDVEERHRKLEIMAIEVTT